MKKIIMMMAATAFLFGMSSCGGDDDAPEAPLAAQVVGSYTGNEIFVVDGDESSNETKTYQFTKVSDLSVDLQIPEVGMGMMTIPSFPIKGISLSKVSKISKIKKCYMRAKNTAFTITVPYEKRGAKIPMVIMTDKGWKNEQYYLWVPSNPQKVSKPIKDAPMTPCDGGSYDPEDPADPLDGTFEAVLAPAVVFPTGNTRPTSSRSPAAAAGPPSTARR